MTKLVILGAGGHGAVVAEAAVISKKWESVSFLDDGAGVAPVIVGCPVIGTTSLWPDLLGEDCEFLVTMGNNHQRDELLAAIEDRGGALSLVTHPSSVISASASLEPGVVVCAGAVINARVEVGRGSIVNTCASIDQDCVIGDATHISPGANIAGGVTIGARTWIGIGAVVKEGIVIGEDCIAGAGAAVVSNVAPGQTVVGVPATPLQT